MRHFSVAAYRLTLADVATFRLLHAGSCKISQCLCERVSECE